MSAHRIKVLVSLVVSVGLLFLAVRQVNQRELGELVQRVNYVYVLLAIAVYFVDLALRSARWSILLSHLEPIPVRRLYPVLAIGYMANNLLPGRIGELSRAYLVHRRERVSASSVLASIVLERLLDGITVLVLLLGALALLPEARASDGWIVLLTRLAAVTFGVAILGCAALVVAPSFWLGLVARLARRLPGRVGQVTLSLVNHFIAGFSILSDPSRLGQTLVLSIGIWVVGAIAYILVSLAFGLELSPVAAVATICIVNLATAVPQAPAGLGAFEAAAEGALVLFGATTTAAFGITVVLHAVLFFPVVLVGLVFLWQADLSLGTLWSGSRREPSTAAEVIH